MKQKGPEFEIYRKLRPSLIEQRATVEIEFMKAKREKTPANILLERILKHEAPFANSLFPATD